MTTDLTDVLAAALRRRVSGTDDDIRRLAESLLADGPLADRLEQAAADARQPFLDLADQLARHTVEPDTDADRAFIRGLDTAARDIRRIAQDDA
jgi:hypothetical protein